MQKAEVKQPKYVYGLDIGTRSVVGTVGYLEKGRFVVVAQRVKEHETRAMIDGQIHDIGAVGETIREVTDELEQELRQQLHQVCIAAAGRVLRTVTTHVETDLEGEKLITKEDIFALDSYGVEKAYEKFQQENDLDMKFYCVGYTVMRYYMNDYPMSNLENHKAKVIAADLIATFLPDDVVDGLYKAVELAGLEVANLTLEPIAAMEVAIPQMYRMLNIALIDVGAGTSDISITKDGSIVAYGMLPIAGDCLTEDIARHCLVDFTTAEQIKRGVEKQDTVEYKDIMGIAQKITKEEVLQVVESDLTDMAQQAADRIKELNGDKPVSAVFVVGGGGKMEGYTKIVAERLGIPQERCALRGEEVMQKIDFLPKDIVKDSLLVTPIGICLNYYEQSNNFMFVTFNGQRIKLYDNNRLAIVDAAISAEFPNEDLFPKRGASLTFMLNGKTKVIRGERGESATILLNGEPADIHTPIRANDIISVTCSTAGEPAQASLGKFPEYKESITIHVNGSDIRLPKVASVNGQLQSALYMIQENDEVEMLGYYTVQQITEVMDVVLEDGAYISVNHEQADLDTKVYDNFTLEWTYKKQESAGDSEPESEQSGTPEEDASAEDIAAEDILEDTAAAPVLTKPVETTRTGQTQREGSEKGSLLEKARRSAQQISDAPVTQEVEEELKAARAYAAAERIASYATAFNQTGQMPAAGRQSGIQMPATGNLQGRPEKGAAEAAVKAAETEPTGAAKAAETEPTGAVKAAETGRDGNTEKDTGVSPAGAIHRESMEKSAGTMQQAAGEALSAGTMQQAAEDPGSVTVLVNGKPVTLSGKPDYIYVDVFDRIDFDLSKPQGKTVETLINGRKAQYIEPLKNGDELEIFWKD